MGLRELAFGPSKKAAFPATSVPIVSQGVAAVDTPQAETAGSQAISAAIDQNTEYAEFRALDATLMRNDMIVKAMRNSWGIIFVVSGLLAASIVSNVYLSARTVDRQYFAVDQGGGLTKIEPLNVPILTDGQITDWVAKAINKSLDMDFVHYKEQLTDAGIFFTKTGYRAFITELQRSGNLDIVKNDKYITDFLIQEPPAVVAAGLQNGVQTWQVRLKGVWSFQNASKTNSQRMDAKITIVRVPTYESKWGVGISQFILGDKIPEKR